LQQNAGLAAVASQGIRPAKTNYAHFHTFANSFRNGLFLLISTFDEKYYLQNYTECESAAVVPANLCTFATLPKPFLQLRKFVC
jgi:hypothetical protein